MSASFYDSNKKVCRPAPSGIQVASRSPTRMNEFISISHMSANISVRGRGFVASLALACIVCPGVSFAAPNPMGQAVTLDAAIAVARASRAETRVSIARVDAARQRPAIVSSLEDPIIAPSIDHKPVDPMMKTDRSITFEQSFPLSRIRSHRRRAAEADIDKYLGESGKTSLRIDAEVAQAFFMLNERRKVADILRRQISLAGELVKLAAARHGVGTATQADVLRTEIEQARLRTRLDLIIAEVRAAEAMFNTTMGQDAYRPVPQLLAKEVIDSMAAPPDPQASLESALTHRPELRISKAEIQRARAEVDVMKSMYAPMAMVRAGMAETGAAGRGYMLMVGVSVPIWFGRLKAGVREANAMVTMADADREAMLRMIHGEVASSLESLHGATRNLQAFHTDLLPRAERAIGPAMAAYAGGTLPLTSVLEASKALWSVQEEAVMSETALGAAWIRHRNAMGTFGESK